MSPVGRPELEGLDDGVPRSVRFDDIYYSPEDGLAETRHVFLDGNDLSQRLASASRPFAIGELGFGTGLNVLATLKLHDEVGIGRLQIWSCEGFPLPRGDFVRIQEKIAGRWPGLAPYAERLAAAYPDPLPGQVRITLGERADLTLAFAPVEEALAQAGLSADAWFLDGFSPSKNPGMWSPEVMRGVAALCRPGATASTFSVASAVRAALDEAGFSWTKTPGFGRKKHMLRARIGTPVPRRQAAPWYARPEKAPDGAVAVLGAGIAGCALAGALRTDGRNVTIFGWNLRAKAASGNPAGLVMPRIDADDGAAARFYRDAYLHAVRTYSRVTPEAFDPCGGSMAFDPGKAGRVFDIGLWPNGALEREDDGLKVPSAGVLKPAAASESLAGGASRLGLPAETLNESEDGWIIETADGAPHGPFVAVVLATGADQPIWKDAPIRPSLGQIDLFAGPVPERIRTEGSYVAPLGASVVAGATYQPFQGGTPLPEATNTEANRREAARLLGREPGQHQGARVALRATTPDRHPIAGPLYDQEEARRSYRGLSKGLQGNYPSAPYRAGLFAFTGLGSRGLVTAPILADHLAALITGGVSPLQNDIAALVHPGRFLIRAIRRGEINA